MKTKHFKSRHALLMSLTSLTLCVSMLFGATFAWFTDSVTSGVNRIVSGNLDVELEYKDNAQTAYTGVTATTKLFNSAANGKLWEPGAMAYETFKVSNNGSLALKYQFALNTVDYNTVTRTSGSYDLRDVLKIAVVETTFDATARPDPATLDFKSWSEYANSAAFTGEILPGEDTAQEKTVVIWWPDTNSNDVDNRYNLKDKATDGWTLDKTNNGKDELYIDLGITLVATQLQNESDSFDNTYDANAEYPSAVAYTIDSKASAELTANITESTGVYTAPVNTTEATTISDADATSTIPAGTTATLTVGENQQSINVDTDKMTALSREIKTTENSSDSVTYDISYNATVTTTTGEEPPTTATYAVHTFSNIVTNEINVGTGLLNVSVTHGDVAMHELTTNAVPTTPDDNGDFYYDAGTGKLYIYSKTYSAYKVSFEQAEVSVVNNGTTTNMTLAAFRDGVNAGTYTNATVTLLRNVNLGGAEWTPIGTKDHPFSGVFDGNGKTISNFQLSGKGEKTPIALFGYIKGTASSFTSTTALSEFYNDSYEVTLPNEDVFDCEVKNLTVSGVTANTTADGWTAAAVSYCENATVKNVTVTNSAVSSMCKVGGVVAYVPSDATAWIDSCKTTSDVTVSNTEDNENHVAGILARSDGKAIVSNCENNATITCKGVNGSGISGQAKGTLFYKCTNNGNVTGRTRSAGITTDSSGSVIINCLNTGSITSSNAGTDSTDSTAGIFAYAAGNGNSVVVNCTNNGSVTANCSVDAIVSGIIGGSALNGDIIQGCVNTGTLTNNATNGLVYDVSNLKSVETLSSAATLDGINGALARANKNVRFTSVSTLGEGDCTINPTAQEIITFDSSPTYLTLDLSRVATNNLRVNVSNATINVTGRADKNNLVLNIVGSDNKITYADSDLNLNYLYVTNDGSLKSEVTVSAYVGRLVLAGSGTVEATVNANTTIGGVGFATAGGKYTLNNYGTISHNDNGTGNQHTVSTIVACTITVNNYGTIEAIGNSYALLFYNGCTVVVNECTGSSYTSTTSRRFAKTADSNVTFIEQ